MARKPSKATQSGVTPKNKVAKSARRVAIVEGLVKQKTPRVIAKALGISRKTVYEELKAPETQQLIQRWLEPYHDDIEALIPLAITTVRDGLSPTHQVKVKGESIEVPTEMPDRIRSVKALGVVLGWAQGKTDGQTDEPVRKFKGTMEELLVVYRNLTAGELPAED